MLLIYATRTGNVKRFVGKTKLPSIIIDDALTIDKPYVLVTYTDKQGQVPDEVLDFLARSDNSQYLLGVAASGNRNWGKNFAKSADVIQAMYSVPIIHKFELSGLRSDVNNFIKKVEEIK